MNIRLSADNIRLRIDENEAKQLLSSGKLFFMSAGEFIQISLQADTDAAYPLEVSRSGNQLSAIVADSALRELIEAERSKQSGLSAFLGHSNSKQIEFRLEIDIFKRIKT